MSTGRRQPPRITMVKKRLASGEPCRKCVQTEEMLRSRGLWDRVDEVVWADEADPGSPGMVLAAQHGVEAAPFFLVDDGGAAPTIYTSGLALIRERLAPIGPGTLRGSPISLSSLTSDRPPPRGRVSLAPDLLPARGRPSVMPPLDVAGASAALADRSPIDVLRFGLERFGAGLALAFSGADDVVLIDLAAEAALPFSVVTVDTGRLHGETLAYVEAVRVRYGCVVRVAAPDTIALEDLVRRKGLFSFYMDGHEECCAIRKVEPLRRALTGFPAWATGQRRDQAASRATLPVIEIDPLFKTAAGEPLVKLNPLAGWTHAQVWQRIRERGLPVNPLHDRGYASIGCAPCTRPIGPGQGERDGRWWWEDELKKECGLHAGNVTRGAG